MCKDYHYQPSLVYGVKVALIEFLLALFPIESILPGMLDIVVAGIVNVEGAIEIELLITTDKKLF